MVMGPNDSGKAQILKAIERALRNPGESQSLVDLYGLTGP
jgi:predicted ATP-binding protein involved in virulence